MRRLATAVGVVVAFAAVAAFLYREELGRLWTLSRLFAPDAIVHNFQHMDTLFPSRTVEAGEDVLTFGRGRYTLPESFTYGGKAFDTEGFLAETATTGLLILHDDTVVLERYEQGHAADRRHIAWSVSKSVVSALFGIAVAEGHVDSIDDPVAKYVPELAGTGYDPVSIKDVLQMSSGVRFDEDYGDPFSDINRMGRVMALGSTMLEFATTLERERPPGTLQHYVSVDTQVLGETLVRATGRDLATYTSEKLWKPLGMESDAYWLLDGSGMEMAFGGLNATLRDFARFGWLFLNEGRRGDQQIVPEDWVRASVTPDAPHLMPGPKEGTSNTMGYGYQWWIPADWDGDFVALGIYNQMIYVHPKSRVVVAKHSTNLRLPAQRLRAHARDAVAPARGRRGAGRPMSWRAAPVLGVANVQEAAEYYRDVLGFELDPERGIFRGVGDEAGGVYALLHRAGCSIHLQIRRRNGREPGSGSRSRPTCTCTSTTWMRSSTSCASAARGWRDRRRWRPTG